MQLSQLRAFPSPQLDPAVRRASDQQRRLLCSDYLPHMRKVIGDPLVFLIGKDLVVPGQAVDRLFVCLHRADFFQLVVVHDDRAVRQSDCVRHFVLNRAKGERKGNVVGLPA